jgi:hypothetical protein
MLVKSESIIEIAKALNEASKNFGTLSKDADNPFFKSKYADLGSLIKVVKNALDAVGITILQPLLTDETNTTYLQTMLLHVSGEFISSVIPIELNGKEQVVGSRLTYFRRYQLQAMLSIPAVDDDGESAMDRNGDKRPKEPEKNKADAINNMLSAFAKLNFTKADLEKKLEKSVNDMTDEDFERATKIYDYLMGKMKGAAT